MSPTIRGQVAKKAKITEAKAAFLTKTGKKGGPF